MKIGIDACLYGPQGTGIGRYVERLIYFLSQIDTTNEYVVFLRPDGYDAFEPPNKRFRKVRVPAKLYSLKEQILMPFYLYRESLDLIHFCHYNVPILYFGRFVVTIHDMIKHEFSGRASTTRSPFVYFLKHTLYRFVFRVAVFRAARIFVPSDYVKSRVMHYFGVKASRIIVTHEAGDETVFRKDLLVSGNEKRSILEKYDIKTPFLIHVGNLYPYKNIARVIEALVAYNKSVSQPLHLVLVGSRNVFNNRLKDAAAIMGASSFVHFAGYVSDRELSVLYHHARAYIFPSLSEGFGIPGVEAQMSGLPVLASDTGTLKEVLGDGALYFDPYDVISIERVIRQFSDNSELQSNLVKRGLKNIKRFSWRALAERTLEGYREACCRL